MWVVTIRAFGADEVGEVIGPFKTPDEAHGWVECYGVPADDDDNVVEWYDVHELTAPDQCEMD